MLMAAILVSILDFPYFQGYDFRGLLVCWSEDYVEMNCGKKLQFVWGSTLKGLA